MTDPVNLNIQLSNVRLDRVSLAKPFQGRPDVKTGKLPDPKYHVDAIIDVTHPQLEAFKELMRLAIVVKFADQAPIIQQQIMANNRLCLHRGDIDRAGKPHYAGKLFISANNKDQPNVVVTEGNVNIATFGTPEVLTPAHPKFPYSGCYANVILNLFAYSNEGKGVSAQVQAVQFLRHGEKLRSSSIALASEFGLVPDAADGAPPGEAARPSPGAGLI